MSEELQGIIALGELVGKSVLQVEPGTEGETSVGFFSVVPNPEHPVTAEQLVEAIKGASKGFYGDVTVERLMGGPSYIELGAWIGDQGRALCLMGLGAILGLWSIVTPAVFGITGEDAAQMMGTGFVMAVPGAESPLRS